MDEIKLIENLIPQKYQEEIKNIVFSNVFPWYYSKGIWGKKTENIPFWQLSAMENPKVTDSYGFTHLFYENGKVMSPYFPIVENILFSLEQKLKIKISDIIRIRARLTTQVPNHTQDNYSAPHFDFSEICTYSTLVYYVHDTDGDTFLFEEKIEQLNNKKVTNPTVLKRITPKQGLGLFFKGNVYHSGNFPIKCLDRVIFNFDFILE